MNIYTKTLAISLVALVTCVMQAENTAFQRNQAMQLAYEGFSRKNNYEAIKALKSALAMPELPNELRAIVLFKLADIFSDGISAFGNEIKANRPKAIKYYQAALAIAELPKRIRALALLGLGSLLTRTTPKGDQCGMQYVQEALDMRVLRDMDVTRAVFELDAATHHATGKTFLFVDAE